MSTRLITLGQRSVAAEPPAPAVPVAASPFAIPTLAQYVDLVHSVRQLQIHYRRTQDSRTRRRMQDLECVLDGWTRLLAADLEAEQARRDREEQTIAEAQDPTRYGPKVQVTAAEGGAA